MEQTSRLSIVIDTGNAQRDLQNLRRALADLERSGSSTEDGYEQAVSFGINNSRKSWQCSKTDKKAVIDEIYRFLIDTKGVEAFNFTPVADEPSIKVRLDGEISRQKQGGDVWQISFGLRQVF
ncbi:phage tail protein [Moraxella bovis]|uniref:phage tail protein n=1 Tax=Moraxella bovis TaxID=476 RepID=UPI0022266A78|nr:phage tail protein [Moraxella bovis]UZA63858.1 phage tail protein [Moraxella bovis]